MQVSFERSGGVAGMRLSAAIDSGRLPSRDARTLQELVQAAKFFDLPARLTSPQSGADRFRYKVTIDANGRRHTVEVDEAAVSPSLRPLLEWLMVRARKNP
jgi:hypothetical protein